MGHCEVRGRSQWEDVDVKFVLLKDGGVCGERGEMFLHSPSVAISPIMCRLYLQSEANLALSNQKSRLNRRDETSTG